MKQHIVEINRIVDVPDGYWATEFIKYLKLIIKEHEVDNYKVKLYVSGRGQQYIYFKKMRPATEEDANEDLVTRCKKQYTKEERKILMEEQWYETA